VLLREILDRRPLPQSHTRKFFEASKKRREMQTPPVVEFLARGLSERGEGG